MRLLYQFPFSHFCEIARWALDYKGLSYTPKNLLAGPHLLSTKKLADKSCVPILLDSDSVIQESSKIIDYLDAHYPNKPLTPDNQELQQQVVDWELYLHAEIGVTLRAWFYYHVLALPDTAKLFLLKDAAWYGQPLYAFIFPLVRNAMITDMNINPETAITFEERLIKALDKLNCLLETKNYLLHDDFSRVDLTACALLESFCRPDASLIKQLPPPVIALQTRYLKTPVTEWVNAIYQKHRYPRQ